MRGAALVDSRKFGLAAGVDGGVGSVGDGGGWGAVSREAWWECWVLLVRRFVLLVTQGSVYMLLVLYMISFFYYY